MKINQFKQVYILFNIGKRFRKYATIIAVLFWFFIGMFIKSFNIHEKITNAFHQTKIELSTLTNP